MKILLTGAPGWLGSRVVDLWPAMSARHGLDGASLRCLVLPGAPRGELDAAGVEVLTGDLTEPGTAERAVAGVDAVLHAAGVIHAKRVSDYQRINTDATRALVRAAQAAGVKQLVLVSSNAAQGFNRSRSELMREALPNRPESPYGRSKLAAEELVRDADGVRGLRTTVLRPCLYYGVRQPERMLRLIRMVRAGRALVFGDGRNLRSMTFIDDIAEALLLALTRPAAAGGTFWIADRRPYTTVDILAAIASVLDVELRIIRLPALLARTLEVADHALVRAGLYQMDVHVVGESVRDIGCDPSLAVEQLGFRPRDDLEAGLREALERSRAEGAL